MDMTGTIVPKSDQLNADDLMAGPITVTIRDVAEGSAEQPANVNLVEFPGRPYRPSKSMRRVMVAAWGPESKEYSGHSLTLYRNPEIMFGGQKVGGIEISHVTNIDKPLTVALTVTRGKRKDFTVRPLVLADDGAQAWVDKFDTCETLDELGTAWTEAVDAGVAKRPRIIQAKDDRKQALAKTS
jgi:hypothetical protein